MFVKILLVIAIIAVFVVLLAVIEIINLVILDLWPPNPTGIIGPNGLAKHRFILNGKPHKTVSFSAKAVDVNDNQFFNEANRNQVLECAVICDGKVVSQKTGYSCFMVVQVFEGKEYTLAILNKQQTTIHYDWFVHT